MPITPETLFAIPVPQTQEETASFVGAKCFDSDGALKAAAHGYTCLGTFSSMGPQLQARKDFGLRVFYGGEQTQRFSGADKQDLYYGIMTGEINEKLLSGDQDAFKHRTFVECLRQQQLVSGGTGGPGVPR